MAKQRRILALDLGSSAFKGILLEFQAGREQATQIRVAELPTQSDSAARDAALKSLLAGLEMGSIGQVVSVIDDPFACLRVVSTPPMPATEQANAIRWQLQPFLAFSPEEAAVEFEPIPFPSNGGDRRTSFLAVAFPRAEIREHLAFLGRAGLKPTQLVPKEMGIGTWLRRMAGPQAEGGVAVLEVGSTGCEFMVFEGSRPTFARKIPGGGAALTKEMTGVLMTAQGQVSLTEAEAETFKRSVGIPGPQEGAALEVKGVSGSQIFSLIRAELERLAMEVERSLAFYAELGGQAKISSLLLVGGGAHLKGLAPRLQERFGIPVIPAPAVLEAVPMAPGALQGSAAAVPLSLVPALGAALGFGRGMNLLPEELKETLRRQVRRVATKGLLTGSLLGALLIWIGFQVARQSLTRQIAAFRFEQQVVASQMNRIRVALAAHDRWGGEPDWETTLRWLGHAVPAEMVLTELAVDGRTVFIRGKARRQSRPLEEALAEFMRRLEEGRMSRVTLRSSRFADEAAGTSEFEITGELR